MYRRFRTFLGCHEKRSRPRPLIIGVGSAGFRIIERIARRNPELSHYLVIDTEPRGWGINPNIRYFTLGDQTSPLPFHSIPPEWARQAVIDNEKVLKKELTDRGLVFIVAGMGGGVGTGAGPAVASLCKSIAALTIALVSMPFPFEGPRRAQTAEQGVRSIKSLADVTLVVRHEEVLRMVPPSAGVHETYELSDEVFSLAVETLLWINGEIGGAFA